MNFSFTDEQRLLEDTVKRFVSRDYTFEQRRKITTSSAGWSRETWQAFAELGLLALNVPEEHGGINAGPVETMLVMNALGTGMVVEPYLSSAVLATWLVRLAGDTAQHSELLPALASGESIIALAHAEPAARYDLNHVATTAVRSGDRYRLTGRKSSVTYGSAATALLVTARTSGANNAETGISLFLVKPDMPGVSLKDYPTVDNRRQSEISLQNVSIPASARIGNEGTAYPAVEHAYDIALAALCAEAVGAMKSIIDATLEYLRTRKQFGQPIGRFQALQHRTVDMLMHYEQATSMSYFAAIHCADENRSERRRALSAAKVVIGRACRFIGQQAVQLHGGMGMTDELNVSHYFKRLTAIELTFGNTDAHLEQFIDATRKSA